MDGEGRLREGGSWLRRVLAGAGLEEIGLGLGGELRGGLDDLSNE